MRSLFSNRQLALLFLFNVALGMAFIRFTPLMFSYGKEHFDSVWQILMTTPFLLFYWVFGIFVFIFISFSLVKVVATNLYEQLAGWFYVLLALIPITAFVMTKLATHKRYGAFTKRALIIIGLAIANYVSLYSFFLSMGV
ncbi:hypothetical protein [Thalassotalea agarivorans]|uniref:Uncharacterized protein n=1 Tax=Thalassotalea agarivorans TaxID=349064 RepID=A0A1I0EPM0_THASX|nr:hypothetical protein [Thalassotalea agarivorans]SET47212.1 hypothetical protein SAMN05660429_01881 [Thalassotalea agarivorans]